MTDCLLEAFPDRPAADLALTRRHTRALLAGRTSPHPRVPYDCDHCGKVHTRRARGHDTPHRAAE